MSQVDDFAAAIASQESGGNYRAVNRDTGALGKYQILPDNVTPWARQYLGIRMTPAQFMANPSLQDTLAKAVFASYLRNYGVRGAAAAWYSGNPALANSYTPQGNYPSIGSYVDSIVGKMGDQPLTRAMTAAAATAAPPVDPSANGNPAFDAITNERTSLSMGNPLGLSLSDGQGSSVDPATGTQLGLSIGTGIEGAQQAGLSTPSGSSDQTAQSSSTAPMVYKTDDKLRLAALQMAAKYLGMPYVYGGTGQGGIDCSALVWRALQSVGINIPRTGRAQVAVGTRVPMNQLQPGDLVAFNGGDHVAIYAGNNQVYEAAHPGTVVSLRTLGTAWDNANNMEGISYAGLFK